MTRQVNGIDLDVLRETISAVRGDPELGRCTFRATNQWINGTHNVGKVETFFAGKQEMTHKEPFEIAADEPPILAGDDSAPNPVEYLLAALASCVTTSMVAHAAVRDIPIEELSSELEGDIDLNGFFGLSEDTPKGYQQVRVKCTVKSDASAEQLESLAAFSPVLNTLTRGVAVDVQVEKAPAAERPVSPSAQEAPPPLA